MSRTPIHNTFFEQQQVDLMPHWFQERVVNFFAHEFPGYSAKMAAGSMTVVEHKRLAGFMNQSLHKSFVGGVHLMRYCPVRTDDYRIGRQAVFRELDRSYQEEPYVAPALADSVIDFLITRKVPVREISNFARAWEIAQVASEHLSHIGVRRDDDGPPLLTYNPTREL